MKYRRFALKLHHDVPGWVEPESLFHVRIRTDRDRPQLALTDQSLGPKLLQSAEFCDSEERWHIALFLLMPDHIHAILSFPRDCSMSQIIGDWKRFHARHNHVTWQEGFFDHRLRNDQRREQLQGKIDYIRQNPVAAGLCRSAAEWPWVIDKVSQLHP